jgi:shikimate dehydrogenase
MSRTPAPREGRALLGLIGDQIAHSITPAMHEVAGWAIGIDVRYHLIDASALGYTRADLPRLLDGVRLLGFAGINVTHPFKQAVAPYLDAIDDSARIVGAVNTIVFRDGRLVGHNTDRSGFVAGWRTTFGDRRPGCAVLVGAGGAGRAIAYGLAALGADELRIVDVADERAASLAKALSGDFPRIKIAPADSVEAALGGADGLVNAAPVGSYAHPGTPAPLDAIGRLSWVGDAVYTPIETRLIAAARASAVAILTGGHMAVGQAVDSFELFFGREAPVDVMRATFNREVRHQVRNTAVDA